MSEIDDITDMTRGVYRRHFAGYIFGKRINAVSIGAEAWFWRVHDAAADDFGNLRGEAHHVYAATIGNRYESVTMHDVAAWLNELIQIGLVRTYEAEGERYLHIDGFTATQPAGKNGKRVRRVPATALEADDALSRSRRPSDSVPGESGGIRVNPVSSSATHYQYQDHNQNHSHSAARGPTGKPSNASLNGKGVDQGKTQSADRSPTSRPGVMEPEASKLKAPPNCSESVPTPASPAKQPDRRPRRVPESPHPQLVQIFNDLWAKRYGMPYPFHGGKDGQHIKRVLAFAGQDVEVASQIMIRYLDSDDPFHVNDRHGLGMLVSQIRRFLSDAPPTLAAKKPTVNIRNVKAHLERMGVHD